MATEKLKINMDQK